MIIFAPPSSMKEQYFTGENIGSVSREMKNKIASVNPRQKQWKQKGNIALLITDMQNYFLETSSHAFIPSAIPIIQNINELIDTFLSVGAPVIFSRHYNEKGSAGMMGIWWNQLIDKNSRAFEIYNKIHFDQANHLINKQHYDAFMETDLEAHLHNEDVESLVIAGVMTNLCCETTLRSAFVKGFNAILPLDATAAYNIDFHFSTFLNLSFGFAPVHTTMETINKLEA